MKNMIKNLSYGSMCFFIFIFMISCENTDRELKIANWNVQTFFDADADGTEYSEFIRNDKWGKEAYIERIERLCSVIRMLDADIFIMEELENEGVLYDISNFLAGEWNFKKTYRYAGFSKTKKASIGCGIISRIPLTDMKLHSGYVYREKEKMPRLRPLMKISVKVDDKELVLFITHWKSKSGGELQTEKWRNMEEGILAFNIKTEMEKNMPVLVSGDFNRDINDFCILENNNILLRLWKCGFNLNEGMQVNSPWFDGSGNLIGPGSYHFRDEWSRIDNFFYTENIEMTEFTPATEGSWCSSETFVPYKYQLWNGKGFSDHLPIVCTVRF